MKTEISASILSCDFLHLEDELRKLECKNINSFHLDIMDGHFVPNISFGPHISECVLKYTSLPIETHLMVTNPLNFIKKFSYSKTIFFHIESNDDRIKVIDEIKKLKIRAGIAINPKTGYEKILPYIDKIDDILIMTVEPGFGGQKFMYDQLEKIERVHEFIKGNGLRVKMSADGGINDIIIGLLRDKGVEQVIMGSFLYAR